MTRRIAVLLFVHLLAIGAMADDSIEYSFLEGASLWADCDYTAFAAACEEDEESQDCRALLDASPKARVQLRLERRLYEFENGELR